MTNACGLWIGIFSGFFPTWFEYLGKRFAAQKDRKCSSWLDAIKFIAEPHPEMEKWMAKIGYDYTESP